MYGGGKMTLYESLLQRFGYNEPIFSNEIIFEDYSKPWIYKELNKLCEQKVIVRFDKGIYYIPKQTMFGISVINPRKIIEKRYIKSDREVFGFYGGQTLLNQVGISTQMPNIIEVYTNNESAKIRDVDIGCQKVRLRKSRVNITESNEAILSFLEMMNSIAPEDIDEDKKSIIVKYVMGKGIKRKDITSYAPSFPDKAMRNLIESEVIYSVTQ